MIALPEISDSRKFLLQMSSGGQSKVQKREQIFKICTKSSFQKRNLEHPVVFLVFVFRSALVKFSFKASIIFFENKNTLLTIMYLPQVKRETEFLPQTGKPNKKVSKTALDNRHSFINKDVLSMKIITAAKQNRRQDPELLTRILPADVLELCGAGDRR